MSELSSGSAPDFPSDWGFPSSLYNYETGEYDSGGMVWYGKGKATKQDIKEVLADPRSKDTVDAYSLCGTDDPDWTTWREENQGEYPYHVTYTPGQ